MQEESYKHENKTVPLFNKKITYKYVTIGVPTVVVLKIQVF